VSTLASIIGAVAAVLAAVAAGWFALRGSRAAAQISAGPASKQVDLSVLQASVERLEKECGELRQEHTRTRSVLWSISRWALLLRDQVTVLGGTPVEPPDDVENYYRSGV
jgi:Tfp pilus assembly protein PilN